MNEYVQKYFKGKLKLRFKHFTFITLLMGGVLFIYSLLVLCTDIIPYFDEWIIFLSLFLLAIGLVSLFIRKREYLPGYQFDQYVIDTLHKKSRNDVRQYIGLTKDEIDEIPPFVISGYKLMGAVSHRQDKGDFKWRSNIFEESTIFFSPKGIYTYTINIDVISNKVVETSGMMFYEDVLSVVTKQETFNIGKESVSNIKLVIMLKGGTEISLPLNDNDNTQNSINIMKKLIESKRLNSN